MMVTHKDSSDKMAIRLSLRDWIFVIMSLAALVGYFVRMELGVQQIDGLKADVKELKEWKVAVEARHAARQYGPSRGDRDR